MRVRANNLKEHQWIDVLYDGIERASIWSERAEVRYVPEKIPECPYMMVIYVGGSIGAFIHFRKGQLEIKGKPPGRRET